MRTLRFTEAINRKNWLLEKISFKDFRIKTPFEWLIDYNNSSTYVEIKEWFVTNFWSIPSLLRAFFNPTKYIGYILHDYLYWINWKIYSDDGWVNTVYYTRRDADIILREAIKVEQKKYKNYKILYPILLIERWLIYVWVRVWGWLKYKKD